MKFLICAAIIFYCGQRVARYGDAIAEKTGLGGLWIGVMLVAIATSLPELFTGVGSSLFVDAPDLSVGNIFGANSYNLVNIALLDFIHKGSPLLSSVSAGQLLTAALSLLPLTIAAAGIFLASRLPGLAFANISLFSLFIIAAYLFSIRLIFTFEQKQQQIQKELHKEEEEVFRYADVSLKTAALRYAFFAVIIAGAGIWLSYIGEEIATSLRLGQNFVGSLFLGFATTLPEITVSIAAIRLGARELAVANMVGSNLFNVIIIFINDLLYRKAPLFDVLSEKHIFTAFVVILMTAVVSAAMIIKPKKKTRAGFSLYAIVLVVIFLIGAYVNFLLGK